MFGRWMELSNHDEQHEERYEMDRAPEDLLRIKTEKLGWRPPFPYV
jgi:hypothetical protein